MAMGAWRQRRLQKQAEKKRKADKFIEELQRKETPPNTTPSSPIIPAASQEPAHATTPGNTSSNDATLVENPAWELRDKRGRVGSWPISLPSSDSSGNLARGTMPSRKHGSLRTKEERDRQDSSDNDLTVTERLHKILLSHAAPRPLHVAEFDLEKLYAHREVDLRRIEDKYLQEGAGVADDFLVEAKAQVAVNRKARIDRENDRRKAILRLVTRGGRLPDLLGSSRTIDAALWNRPAPQRVHFFLDHRTDPPLSLPPAGKRSSSSAQSSKMSIWRRISNFDWTMTAQGPTVNHRRKDSRISQDKRKSSAAASATATAAAAATSAATAANDAAAIAADTTAPTAAAAAAARDAAATDDSEAVDGAA